MSANDKDFLNTGALRVILDCLSDGGYHSGEEVGELLGVSRAAVWKHLQRLQPLGIQIDSVKGRGYRVPGGLDLLRQQQILDGLSEKALALCSTLEVFAQLESTNTYLMNADEIHGRVCLAEMQTSGRGRRGRFWYSPFAQNIYLSVGWAFEGGVAVLEGLSLAIGVALVRALARLGVDGVSLKWPNDVLYREGKLAGILIEMRGDAAGDCQVVIGVGLNVQMQSDEAVDRQITQPWIDLHHVIQEQNLPQLNRNRVVSAMLEEIVTLLSDYPAKGFGSYWHEWERYNAHADCLVELHSPGIVRSGIMRGVNAQGALRLEVGTGEELFYGGELSLRRAS